MRYGSELCILCIPHHLGDIMRKKNWSRNIFHPFLKPMYTHAHVYTHTHTSSNREATEKQSFLPRWKAHCSHTFAWFLPCSDHQSSLHLQNYRRGAEDRVPHTAGVRPHGFHTQDCPSQHFQWMRGCRAACRSHRKKSMVGSGSSDTQLCRRLFTCSKISVGQEKEVNWMQMWEGNYEKYPDQSQTLFISIISPTTWQVPYGITVSCLIYLYLPHSVYQ